MNAVKQIAKHLREFYFGTNWTWSNLKDTLKDVTWQEATTQVYDFNTIATLTYHISYFVSGVIVVFQGEKLNIKDKFSFDHPPINCKEDWENMLAKIWSDAEVFANLIEKLPENKLYEIFEDEKYGIYFRNLLGIIEHSHYHLGQITLIKKFIKS